jgi:hypothetical protein
MCVVIIFETLLLSSYLVALSLEQEQGQAAGSDIWMETDVAALSEYVLPNLDHNVALVLFSSLPACLVVHCLLKLKEYSLVLVGRTTRMTAAYQKSRPN